MPRKEGDMFSFKTDIAEKYGIKAAVVAQFIWESINEKNYDGNQYFHDEKYWCRCSVKMMSVYMPFFSEHMLKDALQLLLKKRLIRKGRFNQSGFDKTNWYTFTEFGEKIMGGGEGNEGK